jgi:CRISPR/Cas system-associated exonuclease Cas4 (RecB family)
LSRKGEIIRASEVSQYAYCARAWWLGQVLGYRSANLAAMQRGTAQHRAHGRRVVSFHRLRRVAVVLLLLAGVALAVWLLVTLGR